MKRQAEDRIRRRPRWTVEELSALLRNRLLPYIPEGREWPADPDDPFDLVRHFIPRIGDAQAQLKCFSLWIGVPHTLWNDKTWRWCFELRYRWGDKSPLSLLDDEWRAGIDQAVQLCLRQWSNTPLREQLSKRGDRPESWVLIANEYAHARVGGKTVSPLGLLAGETTLKQLLDIGPDSPLTRPLNEAAFWGLLARRHAGTLGVPGALRYLDVRDGSYDHLVGRVIYYLQGLENWTAGSTKERFPDLGPSPGLPPGFAPRAMMSGPDVDVLWDKYRGELGISVRAFRTIVDAWIRYCFEDLAPKHDVKMRLVETADEILRRLRPELHDEYLRQVRQFREEFLKPYVALHDEAQRDPLLWSARLKPFRSALEHNPLLNCVFHREVHQGWGEGRPGKSGRPPDTLRGMTCAFALEVFRRCPPKRSTTFLPGLHADKRLSSFVKASIALKSHADRRDDHKRSMVEQRRGDYALLAPLLAALFGEAITPEQVKRKALTYHKRIAADSWAQSQLADVAVTRAKTLLQLPPPQPD